MSELTTTTNTALAIPKEFQGFTDEETNGGMNPVHESYLKSYKYFLSRPSMKAKLQIVNNETDEVVWEGEKIENAVIFYGHEVLRLKRGHVESPTKNEADFTDEENEVLAVSYDAHTSKGNFEANGYGEYLGKGHEDIQGKMRRLYLVMILPGKEYKTGVDLVAASFSVTTIKSLNALRKVLKGYGLPLPIVQTNIHFTEAKSESGQVYDRIDFSLAKKEDGSLMFAHKSADAYRTSPRGLPLLNQIIETHKGAVKNAEQTVASGSIEVSSYGVTQAAEDFKNAFKGEEVTDPLAGKDEVPF